MRNLLPSQLSRHQRDAYLAKRFFSRSVALDTGTFGEQQAAEFFAARARFRHYYAKLEKSARPPR